MSWRELKARLNRCACLDRRSPEAGWSRRRRSFGVCLGLPDPPARATAAAQLPSARLAGRTSGAWRAACEPLAEPRSSRRAAPIAPQTEVVHGATVEAHFLQPLKPARSSSAVLHRSGRRMGHLWVRGGGRRPGVRLPRLGAPPHFCAYDRGAVLYRVCLFSCLCGAGQGCLNQRAIEHTLHHLPRRGHVQARIRLARRAARGAQASWRKRLHARLHSCGPGRRRPRPSGLATECPSRRRVRA